MATSSPLRISFFAFAVVASLSVASNATAQCPAGHDDARFPKGATVYFDLSGLPQGDAVFLEKVTAAFNLWTAANKSNGSNVNFAPLSSNTPSGAAKITVKVGPALAGGDNSPAAAKTDPAVGVATSGEIQLNLNNVGGTFWDSSDQAGYREFALKIMLHEIGHIMGLDHVIPPIKAGASVMNPPNLPNDSSNGRIPLQIQDCDNAKVAEEYAGGPECEGDCGGPECLDEYCGNGPPPAPGPTWCSPSLEFWDATSFENCQQVCGSDGPPTAPDEYNSCLGAWTSELCFFAYEGFFCGLMFGGLNFDGGGGPIGPMFSHSAVRECSGLSWQSPVYKATATACLAHCADNDADACEWEAGSGDCYVEFGSGCQVDYGYYGWSAYVLDAGGSGGGSGGSGGSSMAQHSAVRGCSDYSELGAVYKSSAEECSSYCQANDADACEWHEGSGDCYAEFGNGCYVEGGHGGWWAAVYGDDAASGPITIGRIVGDLKTGVRLLDLRSLVLLIMAVSVLLALGLVGLYRQNLKRPSGAIA